MASAVDGKALDAEWAALEREVMEMTITMPEHRQLRDMVVQLRREQLRGPAREAELPAPEPSASMQQRLEVLRREVQSAEQHQAALDKRLAQVSHDLMTVEIQKRAVEQELQEAERVYQGLKRDTDQHLDEAEALEQMAAEQQQHLITAEDEADIGSLHARIKQVLEDSAEDRVEAERNFSQHARPPAWGYGPDRDPRASQQAQALSATMLPPGTWRGRLAPPPYAQAAPPMHVGASHRAASPAVGRRVPSPVRQVSDTARLPRAPSPGALRSQVYAPMPRAQLRVHSPPREMPRAQIRFASPAREPPRRAASPPPGPHFVQPAPMPPGPGSYWPSPGPGFGPAQPFRGPLFDIPRASSFGTAAQAPPPQSQAAMPPTPQMQSAHMQPAPQMAVPAPAAVDDLASVMNRIQQREGGA